MAQITQAVLDYGQAAEYLGTTPRHLRELVYRREIPFTKLGKRLVRFRQADLDAWLDEQTTQPWAS